MVAVVAVHRAVHCRHEDAGSGHLGIIIITIITIITITIIIIIIDYTIVTWSRRSDW